LSSFLEGGDMTAVRRSIVLVFCIVYVSPGIGSTIETWPIVVQKNRGLTVLIRVDVNGQTPGYGSGIIIQPGHILTAKHILPDESTRQKGDFLIKGLTDWESPSVDFSHAAKLDVEYVSRRYDFAILRQHSAAPSRRYAFAGTAIDQGQSVLVLGYPDGGSLICTAGIASGEGPDGKYATDASVGIGDSGGPVFAASGALLGILIEGSKRDNDGRIVLGYFLKAATIAEDLSKTRGIRLKSVPPPPETIPPLQQLKFIYSVNDEKTDHSGVEATGTDFERSFPAQDGFRIVSASFQGTSMNHVSKGPDIIIAGDGSKVLVRYTLQSGPIYDQWRGWIVGSVITVQQLK
jgi:S1-C subfamily serine protease